MAKKITSPEALRDLQSRFEGEVSLRSGPKDVSITVHMGTCGIAAGARDIMSELAEQLSQSSVDYVTLRQSGCLGLCDKEPMFTLTDETGKQFVYGHLDARKVREIVREHLLSGKPVVDYIVEK